MTIRRYYCYWCNRELTDLLEKDPVEKCPTCGRVKTEVCPGCGVAIGRMKCVPGKSVKVDYDVLAQ